MKEVFSYLTKYKIRLVLVFIIKFIGTTLDLVIPYLLSYILDDVIPVVIETNNILLLVYYGLAMVLASLLAFILSVKANQLASSISSKCTYQLRNDLFAKIETLSCKQIDEVSIPSLISRTSTDTYNIHLFYNQMQRGGLRATVLFIGGLIISFIMDYRLTLVLLCSLPFVFLLIFILSKFGIPLFKNIQLSQDSLVRTIRENLTGVKVIKALSKEDYEKNRYDRVNKEVVNYEVKSGMIMSLLNPSVSLIMNGCLVIVIMIGAILANKGLTQSGKIIAMMSYFTIILNSMITISRLFITFSRASVSGNRISYILNLKEDLTKDDTVQEVSCNFIEFKNVSFSYNGNEDNLKDINFVLNEHESLGIIGSTGSGKTTLLNMLLRLYDTDKGEVFVSYRNVKTYTKEELTSLFGTVFQNDYVFNMSFKDNITFNRDVNEDDITKAIKVSQCDFAYNFTHQLDEMMNAKGSNLSGGQKQRLLIARALVSSPRILILDDASSALDYKTDANMRQKILEEYPKTTLIVVSQRISSIKNCSKIAVMENGSIIALGTHDELIKSNSVYQEIYLSQMGGDCDA